MADELPDLEAIPGANEQMKIDKAAVPATKTQQPGAPITQAQPAVQNPLDNSLKQAFGFASGTSFDDASSYLKEGSCPLKSTTTSKPRNAESVPRWCLDPQSVYAGKCLAVSLVYLDQFEQAMPVLDGLIARDPHDSVTLASRGFSCAYACKTSRSNGEWMKPSLMWRPFQH